ncbi:hypothetical protein KJ359_005577 [Pestalotiopsis sp. 9143b]|nr:hypothetical protein KJ359_005577 [Pestalotiopsis sp. 9143b]
MGSIGRPSILIVPGACSTPEFYVPFVTAVREKGYEIEIVHIPSTNYEGRTKGLPAPSMSDDVALVQARIAELADVGKDVVLMTHSYGGTPGTQSVEGYGKKERLSRGLKGGVVGLAYMCSLIPELGQPAGSVQASMSEDEKPHMAVDWTFKIQDEGWMYHTDIPRLARLCFTSLPQEKAEHWAARLTRHSYPSFTTPLTYQGFKDVPVSYLFCERDLTVPPAIQQAGIDMVERVTGARVDVTRVDCDHVAPFSDTATCVDWIVGMANRLEKV